MIGGWRFLAKVGISENPCTLGLAGDWPGYEPLPKAVEFTPCVR